MDFHDRRSGQVTSIPVLPGTYGDARFTAHNKTKAKYSKLKPLPKNADIKTDAQYGK